MYEKIVSATLDMLKEMPTPVPVKKKLAGFTTEYQSESMYPGYEDNLHFSMGTTYLKLGVRGVAQRAGENAKKITVLKQKELLEGISAVYTAVGEYFDRYARAIRREAGSDERLNHIAEMLEVISQKAPEHFDEALQLMYLMWKLRANRAFGGDIGRLDVRLQPYFEKDIAEGYITEEQVLELLMDFWELLNENCSGDTLVNVMLAGSDPDGSDAGSRLTVLMLETTRRCGATEPHVAVRLHRNLHPDIYRAVREVQLLGIGQATLYNDEVVIPSLIRFGVPKELAHTYCNDGCCEVILDGHSAIQFTHIDAVGTFELAFNNGDWAGAMYRRPNKYFHKDNDAEINDPDAIPGFESGCPEDCETFEEFYQMFLKQYRFQVRSKAAGLRRLYENRLLGAVSSVLVNGSFDYILESGKDMLAGGLPFEDYMLFSGSIPTAADSLMALKKVVFEKKLFTVREVKEAILANYEGYEAMRRQLQAAPKFGNDIDEVDLLAGDIAGHFCDWLEEYRQETGFAVMPAFYGWLFVTEAHAVAATPDGRKYADPIAEHFCATPGRAVNGPTAQIVSAGKCRDAIARATGISVFHLTLPRNLGNSDEDGIEVLDSLDQMMVDCGLSNMTIGIYDRELLRRAQADPENHKDLIVRVWGYSAHFVELSREMQEHVISRIPE